MPDTIALAADLENEALAAGWPRNHTRLDFTTARGNQAMALVTVTVTDPGITENPDSATTQANTPITIPVLDNDVDNLNGSNATLRVGSVTQPPSGQGGVTIAADQRSVVYTPASGFSGQAQFTYTAVRA